MKQETHWQRRLATLEAGRHVCYCGGDGPDTSGQNEAARVNAEIAKEMWGEYQKTYLPMEQQFAQDAQNYDSVEKRAEQAGLAKADVSSAFADQREQSTRNLASMGVDPSSGAWANQDSKMRLAEAAGQAGAQNKARQNVENMGYARKQDAISIGKGMPGTATTAMNNAGNQYGQIASANMQADQNQASSVGNTVGGAAALYGMMKSDGGYIEEDEQKLAGGGLAGNPRMQQLVANNNPAMPMSKPGLSPEAQAATDGIKTYKNVKKVKDMYDAMNAPAQASQGEMLAAQTDAFGTEGAASTFEAAGAGTDQAAMLAEQTAGMEGGSAATVDALGTTGATTTAGATTAAAGAAESTALVAGLEGGAWAGGTAAAAGGAAAGGGAAAAAPLAAMGPVGWAALAGMGLYALSRKDGGDVEAPGDKPDDMETPADEMREARIDLSKGGRIKGAGTETSDSIPAKAPSGSYILNAETVKMLGKGLTKSKVPLRVSKNEIAVPPELVNLIGKNKLDQANQAGLDARYGLSRGRA